MSIASVLSGERRWHIEQGDVLDRLQAMPDNCVDQGVTSIPFWAQRRYIPKDMAESAFEIGMEPTPQEYVAKMVRVFREFRRVLKPRGTLWVNIGDTTVQTTRGQGGRSKVQDRNRGSAFDRDDRRWKIPPGMKLKDIVGVPYMLAFGLRDDGWYWRDKITWEKTFSLPQPMGDRTWNVTEDILMFSKGARYHYDSKAIAEMGTEGKLRARKNVWRYPPSTYTADGVNFATYDRKLVEPMVRAGCPAGGIVLDPFNGVATTGIEALAQGKRYIGLELFPQAVVASEKRIREEVPEAI